MLIRMTILSERGVKVWGERARWQQALQHALESWKSSFLPRSAKTKRERRPTPFLLPSLINETFYPKSSSMNYAGFWEQN